MLIGVLFFLPSPQESNSKNGAGSHTGVDEKKNLTLNPKARKINEYIFIYIYICEKRKKKKSEKKVKKTIDPKKKWTPGGFFS